jgi:two-component system chemotaxis sensor kinase CheA
MALRQAATASRELQATLASWTREPLARRFERLSRQIRTLSRRLGRPEPIVVMTGETLRLDTEGWQSFWSAMVHAVRNAVDHGIESADERRRAGKPEAGTIELAAVRSGDTVSFTVHDDGRGIDWERVAAKAADRGLPCATRAELVEALFADGLTTRDAVTELSGRGVGLSALRQTVEALAGSITVESTPGEGTTFRFSFDEHRAQLTAAASPAQRLTRTSLLPFLS